MRIFCFEKNIYLNSIKNDHADGCRSGCGLIRSILGILELSSEKNHSFITIWKSWFSYEFPLILVQGALFSCHMSQTNMHCALHPKLSLNICAINHQFEADQPTKTHAK